MSTEVKAGLFIAGYLTFAFSLLFWLRSRIERNIAAGRHPLWDK